MSLDLTAKSFSLANARELALYARMAYDEPPTIQDTLTDTRIIIRDLGDYIVVACKGTSDLKNFITDAEFWRIHTLLGGIHRGFYEAAIGIRAQLFNTLTAILALNPGAHGVTRPTFVCGHSLGGALAMLLAKFLRDAFFGVHSVYAFGCPRPADKVFRDQYNMTGVPGSPFANLGEATFTLIHDCDGVARLPGYLSGYRRPGHDEFISSLEPDQIVEDPAVTYRLESDAWALFNAWRARRNVTFLDQVITDHHIDKYIAAMDAIHGEDCPPDSPAADQEAALSNAGPSSVAILRRVDETPALPGKDPLDHTTLC